MNAGTNVVPFGKHKGQPVEVLAADESYVQWLIRQPWFAERYQNLYNVVMHINTDAPQDSPVHNAIQMQLSGRGYGAALAFLVGGITREGFWGKDKHYTGPGGLKRAIEPEFEGWDLRLSVSYTSEGYTEENVHFYGVWMRLPLEDEESPYPHYSDYSDVCLPADVDGSRVVGFLRNRRERGYPTADVGRVWKQDSDAKAFNQDAPDYKYFNHLRGGFSETWEPYLKNRAHLPPRDGYQWTLVAFKEDDRTGGCIGSRILVEIKPELGDDYPSVLRQMVEQTKRAERAGHYPGSYQRVLYTQRYTGVGATLNEVKWFFGSKGIIVVTEEELEWYAAIDAPSFS